MNKLKSIQLKIMLIVGILISAIALILAIVAVNAVRNESVNLAKSEAIGRAHQEAENIQAQIEVALFAARSMAHMVAIVPENKGEPILTRDSVNKMLVSVLQKNPDFLGTYTAWEPDAFDGKDAAFSKKPGHDESGRYIPYWYRSGTEVGLDALAGYEDTTKGDFGSRAGDYYLIPRETRNEAIIDPYLYEIEGKQTLLTSLVVPVMVQNRFFGIMGVDISLSFLQKAAESIDLYDRTAKMVLISNRGIIAGLTGKQEMVGKHISKHEEHPEGQEKILEYIKKGEEFIIFDDEEGLMKVQVPIEFGSTKTAWAVLIEIPQEKIYEGANALMFRLIVICLVLLAVGILTLWWISRTIALPLRQTSRILTQISSQGDFSKRVEVNQVDETGQIGQAINVLMDALQEAITELNGVMGAVSEGNFLERVSAELKGDLKRLSSATNQSIDMLSETLQQVNSTSGQVNSGAIELASSAQTLASGTSEQAASLEEISSTMNEVSSQTKANSENAAQASQLTEETVKIVDRGDQQMKTMLASMDEINSTSADISKIIKTIDEIAFQTNLLALNAAVEAARAGKYGKGFAVVAEEVRNLAARSADAAKNTTELIENSVKEVEKGVDNAGKTAEILTDISTSVSKANDIVSDIVDSSNEQQSGIQEINKGLNQVNAVVQQNSSISEETASASEELSSQSEVMQQLIRRFKLKQGSEVTSASREFSAEQAVAEPIQKPVAQISRQDNTQVAKKLITLGDDEFGKY